MLAWVKDHHVIEALGIYFLYSNAVQALAAPDATSSAAYRWFFGFNHGLAGNIKYALKKVFPIYLEPDEEKQ